MCVCAPMFKKTEESQEEIEMARRKKRKTSIKNCDARKKRHTHTHNYSSSGFLREECHSARSPRTDGFSLPA